MIKIPHIQFRRKYILPYCKIIRQILVLPFKKIIIDGSLSLYDHLGSNAREAHLNNCNFCSRLSNFRLQAISNKILEIIRTIEHAG
jgi:hypothetical protein